MADVLDVSKYILESYGGMTTMKLQKLAYYCQAHSLATCDEQLFDDDFQAWANGPVSMRLYQCHRGYFMIDKLSAGNISVLSKKQKQIIDAVCSEMYSLSGNALSERTHSESPWKDARLGLSSNVRSSRVISKKAIKSYYTANPVL